MWSMKLEILQIYESDFEFVLLEYKVFELLHDVYQFQHELAVQLLHVELSVLFVLL